jgi:Tfp pilus assembly protein PilN
MAKNKKLKPGSMAKYRLTHESVTFVRSELFFVSNYPWPDGKISYETISDIVSLNLETSSPFQESDILYGFHMDRKNNSVFVYSALKERIASIGADAYDYMFPEFLPVLLADVSRDNVIFKRSDRMIVVEKTDGAFSGLRPFDENTDVGLPIVEFHKHRASASDGVILFISVSNDGITKKQKLLIKFKDKMFWHAELHDRFFNSARLKAKVLQLLSFDVSVLASFIAVGAFAFSFLLKHSMATEELVSRELALKDKIVQNIKEKDKRIKELDSFAERSQAYFKILEDVNKLRPEQIIFKSVKAVGGNKLEISAVAKMGIQDVNAYTDQLMELDSLQTVRCVNPVTSGGETRFSIVVEANKS